MPVVFIEFDNVIADTFNCLRSINSYRTEKVSVGTMDEWCMKRLNFNAYILVMIKILMKRGYKIHIYSRRKKSDPYGEVVCKWLKNNNIPCDIVHILDKKEPLSGCVRQKTYLVTTSLDDLYNLKKIDRLSSATVVNAIINKGKEIPSNCDRLYL